MLSGCAYEAVKAVNHRDYKVLPEIMAYGLQLRSGFPTLVPRQAALVLCELRGSR